VLRDGGARVTAHTERGAGHGLTQNDVAQAARWMGGVTAPVVSGPPAEVSPARASGSTAAKPFAR
jgi:hypothetical protein